MEKELKQINEILEKRKTLLGPGQSFNMIIGIRQDPIVKFDLPSIEQITAADWTNIFTRWSWDARYKKLLEALRDAGGSMNKDDSDWPMDPYVKDERLHFSARRQNYLNDTFRRLDLPYRLRSRNRTFQIVRFLP